MDIKNSQYNKAITMRHEEKFICSEKQLFLLENRIKSLLSRDPHQEGEFYTIRSVYFDTLDDKLLEDNLSGGQIHDKFRIRIYDASDKITHLEKKTTIGSLKKKISAALPRNTVENILAHRPWLPDSVCGKEPLDEFYILTQSEGMAEKIIVEYDRSAYVQDIGNVRITFDRNIRASTEYDHFFDEKIFSVPLLTDGKGILEVKYDGILPGYIAHMLDTGSLQRTSFSKYCICRNIIENNGRIEDYYEL